jgi:hypothetical protein
MLAHSRRENGMTKIGPRWIATLCASALATWAMDGRADSDALLATVNKPATFTAMRAPPTGGAEAAPARRARLIISVTNYRPTDDCTPVEAVVTARTADGQEVEIGRFGVTPDRAFDAPAPSEALRFSFPLPSDLAADQQTKFSVALVPHTAVKAGGAACNASRKIGAAQKTPGPSLRVGEVEIR